MTGAEFARAAEALIGTRFRLHGRDPATGLDCVGLVAAALEGRAPLPDRYRLRMRVLPDLGGIAAACGFVPATGGPQPGDVLLARVSPCQFHLLIATGAGSFVHAHAGLGRVVRQPGALDWPVIGHWRLPPAS